MGKIEQEILAAIDKAIFERQEDSRRSHLGASLIGGPCARELWYKFRWATTRKHRAQLLRLFDRGHETEPRFIKWLADAGCEVRAHDLETGEQFRISDVNSHFGGSLDGIARWPQFFGSQEFLLEFKTHNDKSFKKLQTESVKRAKPIHYTQMQVYMAKRDLPFALYCAINKNDDHIYLEIVPVDGGVYPPVRAYAERIIVSDVAPPRINNSASFYICKFCDEQTVCHYGGIPGVNCRTCISSKPVENGEWHCSRWGAAIPDEFQRDGCEKHVYKPELFDAELVESADSYVALRFKNGKILRTGCSPDVISSETLCSFETIKKLPSKAFTNSL